MNDNQFGEIINLNVGGKRYVFCKDQDSGLWSFGCIKLCRFYVEITLKSRDSSLYELVGFRFSTSRQTLTWIPDTFFTSLLSGRISTLVDDRGSIFIDRDPTLFTHVLNYLRTKEIHLPEATGMRGLVHEAEFYGITPLTQQLKLVQELEHSSCGNVLYYGCLNPPSRPKLSKFSSSL